MASENGPSAEDLARIVFARAGARLAVDRADDEFGTALWQAFRREIGVTVTRVSAFLIELLRAEALPLDDLSWVMGPGPDWPSAPLRLRREDTPRDRHAYRHGTVVPWTAVYGIRAGEERRQAYVTVNLAGGVRVRVHVMDHVLQVSGHVRDVGIVSGSGVVCLTVPGSLPRGVAAAGIGRPAHEFVDLPFLRRCDWPVRAVGRRLDGRPTFVVAVGTLPYAMPWVRAD